ncbi:hypothetical protein [Flavobacterium sp. MDT1-60]|uniref:hypothetical protein n=1 Tax=Flavobacterium sp. MDT1-60 TaxID=1979344 RepID=UPI00177E6E23|nr:hypothetical protein [Flavobacterium sp. MDT1-60]QOG02692.1 hypothetical protein IHE43_00135 [Flavobacterium sp. MDT1-60]
MLEEKEEINEKPKWIWSVVLLTIVILFILFVSNNANKYQRYKETFKGETIGFTTRIEHANKTSSLKYYFYSDKKVLSEVSTRGYEGDEYELINKFYKVKYDLNNPEKGHYIILEEELSPDSLTLVKAGFTKTKYYIYDAGVTCKYIEKSKWK